uniref:Uncharacterized protein n=1 Tax=Mycena chlorophos TaxID=658473 RepID=A0ABQ0L158_MYCCL|nr:predicted protein [Mycena chlorophos]
MANGAGCCDDNAELAPLEEHELRTRSWLDALESVEKVHQSSMRIPLPGLVTPIRSPPRTSSTPISSTAIPSNPISSPMPLFRMLRTHPMSKSPLRRSRTSPTSNLRLARPDIRPSPFPIRFRRPAHQHAVSRRPRFDTDKHTRTRPTTFSSRIQAPRPRFRIPGSARTTSRRRIIAEEVDGVGCGWCCWSPAQEEHKCKMRSEREDVGWSAVVLALVRVEVEAREGPMQLAKQVREQAGTRGRRARGCKSSQR